MCVVVDGGLGGGVEHRDGFLSVKETAVRLDEADACTAVLCCAISL